LRRETETETEDYLLALYDFDMSDVDALELDLALSVPGSADDRSKTLPSSLLDPLKWRSPYLEGRGIDEATQRLFNIGYDRQHKAVSFPWFGPAGELRNIKYRSIRDKRFWYQAGGDKIRNNVYGIHIVYGERISQVYVTESETDCLYLWAHGLPAIALGGATLTDRQRDIIVRSPIESIVLATDNDEAGNTARKALTARLSGYVDVSELPIPYFAKDVNDLSPEQLISAVDKVSGNSISFDAW
jgi:DNA primase